MWLNFDVWLPTVLLKPIWRKRCVIVSSVVCAGEYSEATTIRSRPDARSGVEIAQSMEAAHKNAQALKGPELPVRRLEKLSREGGEVERKARGQGGRKPCYCCGQRGIYRTSVASMKPPAVNTRKEGTLQRCAGLLETQLTRAVPNGWKPRHPSRKTMMRLL